MSLPKDEHIAIHLFYYEDMPIKEISEILKIKENVLANPPIRQNT